MSEGSTTPLDFPALAHALGVDAPAAAICGRFEAAALVALAAARITNADRASHGMTIITRDLGLHVARWAYSDTGEGEGKRCPSLAATKLQGWSPTTHALRSRARSHLEAPGEAEPSHGLAGDAEQARARHDLRELGGAVKVGEGSVRPARVGDLERVSDGDWALVLAGRTGCGKTISAARFVADRGGLIVSASSADRWSRWARDEHAQALAASWLLVDDLGDECTPHASEQLRALISERYHRGRFVVITTTLEGTCAPDNPRFDATIHGRYGDHLWSRLAPHYAPLADARDRRACERPSVRGIERAQWSSHMAVKLRRLEREGADRDRAAKIIVDAADAFGVDLGSAQFMAALESARDRRRAHDLLLSEGLREMSSHVTAAARPSAREPSVGGRPSPQADARGLDALTWLDAQPSPTQGHRS